VSALDVGEKKDPLPVRRIPGSAAKNFHLKRLGFLGAIAGNNPHPDYTIGLPSSSIRMKDDLCPIRIEGRPCIPEVSSSDLPDVCPIRIHHKDIQSIRYAADETIDLIDAPSDFVHVIPFLIQTLIAGKNNTAPIPAI
jgi:hypothetical protein